MEANSEYLINIGLDETHEAILNKINETKGVPLHRLTVQDLVFHNSKPILTGNGIYIFKNDTQVFYVGSCTSRNFVERVPAHFDIRSTGWFNSLLKAVCKYESLVIQDEDTRLEEAAKFVFENVNIVLVNFTSYDRQRIRNVEGFVGRTLKPLNTRFPKFQDL